MDLLRRSIGFVVTAVVFTLFGWLLSKKHWLAHDLTNWGPLGALILMLVAVGVLIWAALNPSTRNTLLAFVLGIAAYWWFDTEFHPKVFYFVFGILVVAALYILTVLDDRSIRRLVRKSRGRRHAASASAAQVTA